MIRRIFLCFVVLFSFVFLSIDVNALEAEYNSNLVDYGVYCPYGAVSSDGSLVKNEYGMVVTFYSFTLKASSLDDLFEFDDHFDLENINVFIEEGRPDFLPLNDDSVIEWLREKQIVNSAGNWSCPDSFSDSDDKDGDGYTLYRTFLTKDGGGADGAMCKAGENNCLVSDIIPEVPPIDYTCKYIGQTTGGELIIDAKENERGSLVYTVTYPDGVIEEFSGGSAGIILDEDCSSDIYYVAKDRDMMFDLDGEYNDDHMSFNRMCDSYAQSEIEHFCSGTCQNEEKLCSRNNGNNNSEIDICSELMPIIKIVKKVVVSLLQFIVPILLIVIGTIDLAKAVVSNDEQEMKKATSIFVKRCIYAVAVFLVVAVVTFVMNFIAESINDKEIAEGWLKCWTDVVLD